MNDDIILYWVLGILIWGLIWGVVTRSVSSSKGYNDGFAWGFFLGIIGLIVVACRPNKTSSSNSNSFSNNYQYYYGSQYIAYCGNCGFPNRSDSVFCLQCGSKLPQNSTNIGGKWKCKCGKIHYNYETSCPRCGEKKSEASSKSMTEASSKSMTEASSKSMTEQLEELKKLQEQGLITEADFDAKKKQILKL